MLRYDFLHVLAAPAEYDFEINVLPWLSLLLSIGFLFTHIHLRKLKKQKEELDQRVKAQEAELINLKQQENGAGKETE